MKVFERISDISEFLCIQKSEGKLIGLVPTMGALHEGHLTLIRKSLADNDVTVVSIFVNPIQFNNLSDLEKYPRIIQRDSELLSREGVSILFIPSVNEMYPEPVKKSFDFGSISEVMEGAFRPGHFNGVAIVVERLFDIIKPDRAYFGEKDYQQLVIIKELIKINSQPVKIISCPISREEDGLARSSRNVRLDREMRQAATYIYSMLLRAKSLAQIMQAEELEFNITQAFKNHKLLKLEYFTIADGNTLQPVRGSIQPNDYGFIAVYAGEVRLIDNIRLI